MSKGKRYDGSAKLNLKKVFAVIIAIAVIIMFIIGIITVLNTKPKIEEKQIEIKYFPVYTQEKWGVIDTKGNIIIEPNYDEMIVIPDNTKKIFICTYDVDYNNQTYKTKVINEKNEEIYTNYEIIEPIQNFDEQNNMWYERNVLKVKKGEKYGLIDLLGNEILKCEYDQIDSLKGTQNSLITIKDGKQGLVDNTGSIIIPNEYKSITSLTNQYENGYIVENAEGKFGVIKYNKEIAIETKYEEIQHTYGNENYIVKQSGKWKLIDKNENILLQDGFDKIKSINGDNIIIQKGNQYGVITQNAEQKIPVEYQDLTYIFGEFYIAKKQDKYGIIKLDNEIAIPFEYEVLNYRQQADFIEGQKQGIETDLIDRNMQVKVTGILSEINLDKDYIKVRVGNEYKYYDFKFEEKSSKEILKSNTLFLDKKDGKYGYVDKNGIVVVDYQYDDGTQQNDYGFVAVKKDGLWGAINEKGEIIIAPQYQLEENPLIDFIGKWHKGEDLNVNYYTD